MRCHKVVVKAFSSHFPISRVKKSFSFCAYCVACNENNALISYLKLCCLSTFLCAPCERHCFLVVLCILVSFVTSLLEVLSPSCCVPLVSFIISSLWALSPPCCERHHFLHMYPWWVLSPTCCEFSLPCVHRVFQHLLVKYLTPF
jgi:hypothetical protein